ncbi:cell wall-binding repeat-containing protein [Euzebya sp.]|uniref:cell wall-binding repeat-containing protein n=1 Tax=Euzebya sp. TaxID=1971409 RepID=UPI0035140EA2
MSAHLPSRLLATLALLIALVLLAALAPAVLADDVLADDVLRRALPDGIPPTAGTTAAYQANGCYADGTDDVRRGPEGPVEAAPQADVTQFCVDNGPDGLGVSMTVPQGTDPAADPTWNDLGAGAVFIYQTAGGVEREIQLSTQRSDGVLEYLVLEGTVSPTLVCSGAAAFEAGTYHAGIPADCAAAADPVEVVAGFLYDRSRGTADALVDLAPGDGDQVAVPREVPAGAERITRLEGPSRVETAIAISAAAIDDGQADAVVVALASDFPDAVVGAPLAVANGAPLLLTHRDRVPEAVLDEATRVLGGQGRILLLGGEAALEEVVAQTFRDAGHDVERIAGDSRFSTAVAVAEATTDSPAEIVLAFGGDFPAALLAGAFTPPHGGVALLVDRSGIPAGVQAYLDAHSDVPVFAMGNVAAEVAPQADGRVVGSTPSQISGALLDLYEPGGEVAVASVEAFPDGLAGGAYAGARGIPLLLTPRDTMTTTLLDDMAAHGPYDRITFFGGVSALSATTAGQASAHLR